MASLIYNSTNKTRHVQWTAADGTRPTIYLGKVDKRLAETVKRHVEILADAKAHGHPVPTLTAEWAAGVYDKFHAKLAKAGLVEPRKAAEAVELGAFLDAYLKRRTDLKQNTLENFRQVRAGLVGHFGAGRDLRTITRGEMLDWHRELKAAGYAGPTIAMHVKKARQMFGDAIDRKIIGENPVRGIKAGSMANPDRFVYVTPEQIAKVIDNCPDAEWKLIFGLARYAALRTPSETLALKWADVLWDARKLIVRSSKTERHADKGKRTVPIAPAMMPLLRDAFERAADGAVYVIAEHRNASHRTRAFKIIDRAGVPQWGKIFQNLRSSCETDWATRHPIHVACAWAGNSEAVARKHYLQVGEQHFAAAAESGVAESDATKGSVIPNISLTSYAYQSENPAFTGFSGAAIPPRGGRGDGISPLYLGVGRKAVRIAMRRMKDAGNALYRAEVDRLRHRHPRKAVRK